ncbi:uncharacterized mitochondrial protein AtMg00810-like [Gossypium hirsutum]|uniref:Uncharacterized mitochondrial protein AtMg00810-like n=1 Tax=Gossypium hirsutum TaxID=3635 RepID=A0ABM3A7J7_GOSHI|nr:uncharacterized mitochondrial protein AtMg00810-like [Gossypium hirsutum]
MEMSRCMLHEKNLPKKFWVEAANTVVFLQNRLPTKTMKEHTPFETKRDKLDRRASPEAKKDQRWIATMEEELSMIEKNNTWILMDRPQYRKIGHNQVTACNNCTKRLKSVPNALYGLKQAPRAWYSKIDEHLLNLGFVKSLLETTLYVKHNDTDILIVSLYVDDLLVTGNNTYHIQNFKQKMMKVFKMTDLGFMSYFLSMTIKQAQGEVFIYQKKYAKKILKKFQMEECKATSTPMNQKEKLCKEDDTNKIDEEYFRSLIGCLMYLTATRPDILNVVSILSRFMHCVSELHLKAAKRVIRYVKGTSDFGVKFIRSKKFKLVGFSDSDWGGSIDDMKSTSGYCFTLGFGVFSWSSKK